MKKYQEGAASLLFSGLILIAALTLLLTSYKSTFFQAKRVQNEIEARQNQWAGEGAVECAFTKAQQDRSRPQFIQADYLKSDCQQPLALDGINVVSLGSKKYSLQPLDERSQPVVQKVMDFSSDRITGAIQSTGDLFMQAATLVSPPDPGEETEEGWECVTIRYKNAIELSGSLVNHGVQINEKPYDGFEDNGKNCIDLKEKGKNKRESGLLHDTELKPFEAMFEISKSEWMQVRDNPKYDFTIITGDKAVSGSAIPRVTDCGQKVKELIELGNTHIWIDGSCEITGDNLSGMAQASQSTEGVLLMVHNGVFSLIGSGNFKGVLFQLNDGFQPTSDDWVGLEGNDYLSNNGYNNQVHQAFGDDYPDANTAAYFQRGSFNFTGGQFLDVDDQLVMFHDSLKFSYNEDVIDAVLGSTPPRWVKGSWQDF
ncbi:hypothetical protein [Vibrio gangliei]|uniref:hypothetical protein n=1 Tax=Vibrio gangliei TaxID=2077090 RepID=UPI000D0158CD|nr:hypothetical protein [Vibrio gangliei]